MGARLDPFSLLVVCIAGWMKQEQKDTKYQAMRIQPVWSMDLQSQAFVFSGFIRILVLNPSPDLALEARALSRHAIAIDGRESESLSCEVVITAASVAFWRYAKTSRALTVFW